MNWLKNILSNKIVFGSAIGIIFIIIFTFNRLLPLFADDWVYSFVFENSFLDHSLRPISNLSDLLVSQYNHYMLWGGRSVVHFIAQILLALDPLLTDLLNSLAYIAFVLLVYKFINYGQKTNVGVFIFIVCTSWIFMPQLVSNIFWITGSANYLWGTLILLVFLYPFYKFYMQEYKSNNSSVSKSIGFFFLGVLAGWTNENSVPPIILILFVLSIYLYKKKELPLWIITGLIGLIIGFLILVLAPGNYIRMGAELRHNIDMIDAPFITIIKDRISRFFSRNYLGHMRPLVILYLIMCVIYYKYRNTHENKWSNKTVASLSFFLAAHVSFFVMIAATTFPLRAMFAMIIYMIIAIGILYSEIKINTRWKFGVNIFFIFALMGMFGYDVYKKYPSINLISTTFKEREAVLNQQKAEGVEDIVFDTWIGLHEKYGFVDLSLDSTKWMNREYSKYHGVKSVKIEIPSFDNEQNDSQ